MFSLVYKSNKYLSIRPHILHWNIYQELNVWIASVHWICAINYSMLVRMMPFADNAIVWSFYSQSLCWPIGIKFIEMIIIKLELFISTNLHICFRRRNLPKVKLTIKHSFFFTYDITSEMNKLYICIILIEWRLLTSS